MYTQELSVKPVLFTPSLMTRAIRKSTYSKFDDDTAGGCAAIHNDLDRLKKMDDGNLMKFYKGKCKVLHVGRNILMH